MRTSGAASEHRLTFAVGIVALSLAMLLAGGPKAFFLMCEYALRGAAETIYQTWVSVSR